LEFDKTELKAQQKNFEEYVKIKTQELDKKTEENKKILQKITTEMENIEKKKKELDETLKNVYNKNKEVMIKLYSKMKPDAIAEILNKMVSEDEDKAVLIIQTLPETLGTQVMMKMESNTATKLTKKFLNKEKYNGEKGN
jgi:flagellar motility protein MotE (MotC chaperone)